MNTMILAIGILLLAFIVIMVYKLKQSPQGKKKIMAATAVAITLGGAGVYSVTNQAVTADDFFQVLYDNTASCGGDIVCRGAFVFENVDAANIDIEFTFEYLNGSDASAEISDYSVYVSSDTCFEPDPTTTTIETTSTIKESTTTTTASSTASFDVVYVYPDDFVLPNNTLRADAQVDTDVKDKCKDAKYGKKKAKIKAGEKLLVKIEATKNPDSIVDWKPQIDIDGIKVKQDKWAIWGMVNTGTGVQTSPIAYYPFETYIPAPTVNATGQTAQYHMDGNAADGSGNGYSGAVTGATATTTNCKYDGCYSYDGNGDYIKICDEPTCTWSKSICDNGCTFCAWLRPVSTAYGAVFGRYDSSGDNDFINLRKRGASDLDYQFTISGDGSATLASAESKPNYLFELDTFQHICGVYNGSTSIPGNAILYANGVNVGVSSTTVQIDGTAWDDDEDFFLGLYDDSSLNYPWNGTFDEALIYSRALSDEEIRQLYLGAEVQDESGNGNTGSIAGAYNVSGVRGSGIYFDGTDGKYIQSTSDNFRPVNDFSFGAWVRHGATSSTDVIASTYLSNDGYVIDFTSADIFRYVQYNNTGGSGYCIASATGAIPDNTWTHVFATIDSNQLISLYVDGLLNSTTQCTGDVYYSSTNKLTLGRYPTATSNRVWNGTLDDFRFYDFVLTPKQIEGLYQLNANTLTVTSPENATYTNATRIPLDVDVQVGVPAVIEIGVDNNVSSRTPDWYGEMYDGINLWRFDNDATDNWGSSDATVVGATQVVGKFGGAYNFDGNDYAYVPYGTIDNDIGANGFSMCMWANIELTQPASSGYMVYQRGLTVVGQGYGFLYSNTTKDVYFSLFENPSNWRTVRINIPPSTWTHLCVTFNGSTSVDGNLLLYRNGNLVNVSDTTIRWNETYYGNFIANLSIGALVRSDATSSYLVGKLDEIAIYKSALSDEAIKALYERQRLSYLDDDTVLYMDFEEYGQGDDLGTLFYDYNGQTYPTSDVTDKVGSNDAVVYNAVNVDSGRAKFDDAIYFDGTDDVTLSAQMLSDDTWTYCLWANATSTSGTRNFFLNGYNHPDYTAHGHILRFTSDSLNFRINAGSPDIIYGWVPNANEWNHYCLTRDGTSAAVLLYVNGVLNSTDAAATTTSYSGEQAQIGALNSTSLGIIQEFAGMIDDFVVADVAMSAQQIEMMYLSRSFNGTAIDHSNYENDGVIVGAVNTTGKYGSGMVFDGVNDYVTIPAHTFTKNNETLWVSSWFKTRSLDVQQRIWSFSNSTNVNGLYKATLVTGSDNHLVQYRANGLSQTERVTSCTYTYNYQLDTWYKLDTSIVAGGDMNVYLNGKLICTNSTTLSTDMNLHEFEVFDIGDNYFEDVRSNYFNGTIDNVIVSNREPTPEEIRNMYLTDLRWHNDTHWTLTPELDVEDYGELYYDFESYIAAPTVDGSGSPVAQYHLDGNYLDDSGSGYDGTGAGSPASVTGKYATAYNFSTAGDCIRLPGAMISDPMSVSMWLKPQGVLLSNIEVYFGALNLSDTGNERLYAPYGDDFNSTHSQLGLGGGTVGNLLNATDPVLIEYGKWSHVVVTYDGTNMELWKDGQLVLGGTYSGLPTNQYVGIGCYYATAPAKTANAAIDEVLVYDRVLNSEEINQLYLGSKVKDVSLNINEGELVGAYNTTGKYGSGMKFSGDINYILAENESTPVFGPTICDAGCSFMSWVKLDNNGVGADYNQALISRFDGTGNDRFFLLGANSGWADNTYPEFRLDGDGTTTAAKIASAISATALEVGTWYHVAGVYNGSTTTGGNTLIYINGVYVNKSANVVTVEHPAWDDAEDVFVGMIDRNSPTWKLNGTVDDVRMFSRALSDAEIAGIYAERSPSWGTTKNITFTACNTAGFCTSELRMTAFGDESVNITVWDGAAYVPGTDIQFRCTPTQTDCAATNQDASNGIYNMQNNGTYSADLGMKLTSVCTDIAIKCDTDNDPSGATVLTAEYQTISAGVAADASDEIWCWADYSNPDQGCQFTTEVQYTHTPT